MKSKKHPAKIVLAKNKKLSNINKDFNSKNDDYKLLNPHFKAKTGRPAKMEFSDIMLCLEAKRKYSNQTWLGLHRSLIDKEKFGGLNFDLPTYANFLKSVKKLIRYLWFLINCQISLNRQNFFNQDFRIAYVDSTSISVCKTIRSGRHKTMNKCDYPPDYSKSTMGWFYGYKLHLTTNWQTNEVLDFQFSGARWDDRQYLKEIMENEFNGSQSMFVADKGYQAAWLEELAKNTDNYLITGKKKSKNMKVLASQFDIFLLHNRAAIESVFSNLKQNCFLTNTRSRSVLGYIFNYVLSIYYLVFKQKFSFDI